MVKPGEFPPGHDPPELVTAPSASPDDALEATELVRLRRHYSRASTYYSSATRSSGVSSNPGFLERRMNSVRLFWRRQISIKVDHDTCRDYLVQRSQWLRGSLQTRSGASALPVAWVQAVRGLGASVMIPRLRDPWRWNEALERTFLGYLRTSLALSMIGIVTAQLFRLQHAPNPNAKFGFYALGKPLSCTCQGAAVYVLAIGSFRTWRCQNALVRGKAISGGYEIVLMGVGIFLILLLFFIVLVAIDIDKEDMQA